MSTLDELNPKQKAKEFKATQKAIGSKDIAVKLAALEKLNDARYFTEGACLQPFFDSLIPSKKLLEYTPTAFAWLATKLKHNHTLPLQENDIFNLIQNLQQDGNDLDFLKSFVLALTFKEEIKYPKSKKKLAEFVPPPETVAYITIRESALKCLYYLTLPVHSMDPSMAALQQLLACSITNMISTLADMALAYYKEYMSITIENPKYYECLQYAYYAWRTLSFFTRHYQQPPANTADISNNACPDSQLILLAQRQDLHEILPSILADKVLGQSAAIILMSLLQHAPLTTISQETFIVIIQQYEAVGKAIKELTKSPEPVPVGKNGKPLPTPSAPAATTKPTGKGGAAVSVPVVEANPMDGFDMVRYEPLRQYAMMSVYYSKILTVLLQRDDKGASYVDPAAAIADAGDVSLDDTGEAGESNGFPIPARIVHILHDYLLAEPLWACMHTPLILNNADEVLYDVLLTQPVVVLELLTHVSNSSLIREKMMQVGAVSLMQSFLLHSSSMYTQPPVPFGEEKDNKNETAELNGLFLSQARGLVERTCMHLLIAPLQNSPLPTEETLVSGVESQCRLTPCEKYPLNLPQIVPLLGDQFWPKVLLILQSISTDIDLGTRGVRILASLLAGKGPQDEETLNFIASQKLDVLFIAPLSIFLDFALLNYDSSVPDVHKGIPTLIEGIYDVFVCLELFLSCMGENNVTNIKTFAEKNRLQNIANFIQVIGPNVEKAKQIELNVETHDARAFRFSTPQQPAKNETVEGNYRIRSLVIDLLSIIVASDALYRKVEGNVAMPLHPLTPVPVIISPTEDCALNTIVLSADLIIQILSLGSEVTVMKNTDNTVVLPGISVKAVGCAESVRHDEVIQSSLAFLIVAGSCTLGLPSILQSISSKGWDNDSFLQSSLKSVANVLMPETNDTLPEETFQTLVSTIGTSWKRPQFFDEVFPHGIDTDLTVDGLKAIPQLWPFLALAKSFLAIIADASYSSKIARSALQALQVLTKCYLFTEEYQSVVVDLLVTSFLLLGGGVSLVGLIGRFGQLDEENKQSFASLAVYLFSRGQNREQFWHQWAIDHKEDIILDPKTGKPIVKKDDKKKEPPAKDMKKKDGKNDIPITVAVLQPEMIYNFESTDIHPDPNHGPNRAFWSKLLNQPARCVHLVVEETNMLCAAVIGRLTDIASLLLSLGINVNYQAGYTALMYALLLDDGLVLDLLLGHPDIDLNMIDKSGTPTLFYTLMTLDEDFLQRLFTPHNTLFPSIKTPQFVKGSAKYLKKLVGTLRVDLHVRDKQAGNSILLLVLGLGHVNVTIGGYCFDIQHVGYTNNDSMLDTVRFLVDDYNADINLNNFAGFVPLTIAACRNDVALVNYLLSQKAAVNQLDCKGYHILHHVLTCSPTNTIELMDILIKAATFRPVIEYSFEDDRTGKNETEKSMFTLTQQIDALLIPVFLPTITTTVGGGNALTQTRLQRKDILQLKSKGEGFSLLVMALAGEEIVSSSNSSGDCSSGGESNVSSYYEVITEMIVTNIETKLNRIENTLHLLSLATAESESCLSDMINIDNIYNMTVMHAAALCLKGHTEQVPLTAAQIRSKRVKSYPSNELKLLDIFMQNLGYDIASLPVCSFLLPSMGNYQPWTVFHAALVYANLDYLQMLLDNQFHFVAVRPVHFLAQMAVVGGRVGVFNDEVCMWIVNLCAKHEEYKVLLSSPCQQQVVVEAADLLNPEDEETDADEANSNKNVLPLHAAVLSKQLPLIKALVGCSKIDLNIRMGDKLEGSPAFAIACRSNDLSLVQAFTGGKDRLDLTLSYRIPATQQIGSVVEEVVLVQQNVNILRELIVMRRNDVIEQALAPRNNATAVGGGGGSLFEVLKARGPSEMVEMLRLSIREVIADFDEEQEPGIEAADAELYLLSDEMNKLQNLANDAEGLEQSIDQDLDEEEEEQDLQPPESDD